MARQDKPLHQALAEAVSAVINSLSFAPTPDLFREGLLPPGLEAGQSQTVLDAATQHIVDSLLREAYANGLPGEPRVENQYKRPSSGSTAEEVLTITSRVSCVFKCDSSRKLAEEARMLRELKRRADLPEDFRNRFPFIYAAKTDHPPYAYLMEYFDEYIGLESILFANGASLVVSDDDVFRIVTCILDCLFGAYKSSIRRLHKPNIDENYFRSTPESVTGPINMRVPKE